MTNQKIYNIYQELSESFLNENRYLPAKVNYSIQKNLKNFGELSEEMDLIRLKIIKQYGQILENGECKICPENIDIVNKELQDLSNIDQDVNILYITLKDIDNIDFTPAQMRALLFMIKENEEDK